MIIFLNKLNDYWDKKIDELKEEFPDVKFIPAREDEGRDKYLPLASGIVASKLTTEDLNKASSLKILFIPFTGINFFPTEELKNRNIMVSNSHGNSRVVAERAVALALALLGRIVEFHNDLKQGYWHRGEGASGQWTSIQGRPCGILGVGHVGRHIAKLLKTFDCRVVGFKKHRVEEPPQYVDEITNDLLEAIDKSEVIFICLPETKETEGIIDKEILSRMRGKYLVNVGRARIVKEEALYRALKEGVLSGAGLDVWYKYPKGKEESTYPSNYPFHELPNVVITPHNAGNNKEARELNIDGTIENIQTYLKTGKPLNLVNLDLVY